MARLLFAIATSVALTGCNNWQARSDARAAEKQYEIATRWRGDPEKCAAAREVEQAWLRAGDERQYQRWSIKASIHCMDVLLDQLRGGSVDNLVH